MKADKFFFYNLRDEINSLKDDKKVNLKQETNDLQAEYDKHVLITEKIFAQLQKEIETLKGEKRRLQEELIRLRDSNITKDELFQVREEHKINIIKLKNKYENDIRLLNIRCNESNKTITDLRSQINHLEFRNRYLEDYLKGRNLNVTDDSKFEDIQCDLITSQVIHLVHYAGIVPNNPDAQSWAVVLHLLSGKKCSMNTLRQKFYKQDLLTPANREKIEKLFNDTLNELKKKNKGKTITQNPE